MGAERVTRFSFSSAPGANAHRADAQLPAYWRIEGKKDTKSGRRLPRTGKKDKAGEDDNGQPRRGHVLDAETLPVGKPQNKKIVA